MNPHIPRRVSLSVGWGQDMANTATKTKAGHWRLKRAEGTEDRKVNQGEKHETRRGMQVWLGCARWWRDERGQDRAM